MKYGLVWCELIWCVALKSEATKTTTSSTCSPTLPVLPDTPVCLPPAFDVPSLADRYRFVLGKRSEKGTGPCLATLKTTHASARGKSIVVPRARLL